MLKKIVLLLTLSLLVLSGCGSNDTSPEPSGTTDSVTTEEVTEETLTLTLAELAEYNGKDGNPAYIAVDGIIYDASGSTLWKDGGHNGFEAGNDLTEPIKNISPHGTGKLKNLPVVGELKD